MFPSTFGVCPPFRVHSVTVFALRPRGQATDRERIPTKFKSLRKLEKAVAVRKSLLERFSGKFRRCWKMILYVTPIGAFFGTSVSPINGY